VLENQGPLDVIQHHNQQDYSGQEIILLEIDHYVWMVPCRTGTDGTQLITAFRSRKYTKLYLGDSNG
tara:strand:- start:18475 stop:18675 length:201 start_codon:yes stop_codon:yes gene_type:complete